jgi:hypothetical protein
MHKRFDFAVSPVLVALAASLLLQTLPATAQQRQALQTRVAAPAGAQVIGRLPASQQLNLAISLPLRNQAELTSLLQQLYDPASPNYRRFLSVQEFADRFGPDSVDQQRVIGFLQSNGLAVAHTFASRLVVDVRGSVSAIERAFQVTMYTYRHPTENRTFYAPDVEPTVEEGLPVLSIEGFSTFNLPQPLLKRAAPGGRIHSDQTGSGPGGQFLGSDMRAAYGGGTPLDGAGQVVGLIELGPYRPSDVFSYFSMLGQPLNVPIVNVLVGVDGVCSLTEPSPGPCNDGEEAIDIQQAISMAPNLSALLVYETNGASTDALSAYTQAASDNIAKQISISFGWGGTPGTEPGYEQVFQELAAQGQSSFVASGDSGGNAGGGGYPGNSPNITDAGGTQITTVSAGGAWQSETGWNGSGGGWNTESPIPSGSPNFLWDQTTAINSTNGGDPSYRNIPDVSAEANTDNYFCANESCQGGIGGTSLASPRWAGFVSLINQQAAANATAAGANSTLGFLNPTIYPIGQGSSYGSVFHDITSGSNPSDSTPPLTCTIGTLGCLDVNGQGLQGFNAVTGFDLVTGWGSPNGPTAFSTLFPTTANPNFSMSATPSVLSITPGNGGTSSIAIADLNGFNATTDLSIVIPGTGSPSYAPPGLSASLSASSISAGGQPVTLTVSTTSSTPGGTYVIAIVGTCGDLTQTAYVTVELPAFVGLTTSPIAGVLLNQNGTGTATVTETLINGFNGTVNLTESNAPNGVSATFTPVNATTTTATFSATTSAALTGAASPSTVGVSGSATGFPTQSSGINLFINPPLSGGTGTPVDLSSVFNVYAFYNDANESSITASNSLDGVGYAYSANLLSSGLDSNGTQFNFGPANQPDAVYGTGSAIALPSGSYGTLQMLATGIEGNQAGQTVTVNYTDSASSSFTQSFSDWCSALNGNGCVSTGSNPGESIAVSMPYRDSAAGPDDRVFYLYHYSFALNTGKTVQSLSLPSNRDVVVLAVTLTPVGSYSLSAGAPSQGTISPGGSSQATVTVSSANGYTGTVTLSCSIAPVVTPAPTCAFGTTSPVVITASGGTATMTFTAIGPSGALAKSSSAFYALLLPIFGLALTVSGCASRSPRKNRLLGLLLLCVVLSLLMVLPSCGGGSGGGGGGGGGGNNGTPAGTYTVTITGTDANGLTQSGSAATVTITVN